MGEDRATIAVDGGTLGVRRSGSGAARVVFLHAGVADSRAWEQTMAQLADVATCLAYDRRGFGSSPAPSAPFSHLDDLMTVLDELVEPGPVWLVGNSMGGALALDAALVLPDRIAGLALFAPAVSGEPDIDDAQVDAATRAIDARITAAADADDRDALNQLEAWLWLDGPAGPEGRVGGSERELLLDMNAIALRNESDEFTGASELDAWSQLEQIACPTLVAWGELEIPLVAERCQVIAERIPGARGVELPGTAHLPSLEQPAVVAQLVRALVQHS